jgi:hypothetical protein
MVSIIETRFTPSGTISVEMLRCCFVGFLVAGCAASSPAASTRPAATSSVQSPPAQPKELRLDVTRFGVMKDHSGDVSYYSVAANADPPHIQARYRPPLETVVFGYELPERVRETATHVRWKWRAVKFPVGGDECADGKGDSVAIVYLSWKSGLRYYTLKYVWSPLTPRGSVCASKRNPFLAQDTIVLQSGGALGEWKSESIDLAAELRKRFFDGDPDAELPRFLGLAILSDGDQTQSESAADYADFVVVHR